MPPSSSVTRLSGPVPSPVALRPSLTAGLPFSEETETSPLQDAGQSRIGTKTRPYPPVTAGLVTLFWPVGAELVGQKAAA